MCLGNTSSVRKDWHEAKCAIYHNTLDSIYFFCIESDHDLSLNLIKYCQSLNYNTGKQGNIVGQITQSGIEHFIFLQFGQRLHTMFCYTESDKQQPGVMDRYSRGMPNKVTRSRLFADNQLWILAVVNLCLVFAFFFFFFIYHDQIFAAMNPYQSLPFLRNWLADDQHPLIPRSIPQIHCFSLSFYEWCTCPLLPF